MIQLDFELKSQKARARFAKLSKSLKDLRPVWNQFIPQYKELINTNFDAKGKVMEGKRWKPLTKPYLKWKQSNFPGKSLLVLTGNLKEKALNFKSKASKNSLTLSVPGKPYLFHVQHRQKYGRFYFHTQKNDLPMRAWRQLIDIVERELENG